MTSKFLQINKLHKECIEFMRENLNVENCLETKRFAHIHNEKELEESCLSFLKYNFT